MKVNFLEEMNILTQLLWNSDEDLIGKIKKCKKLINVIKTLYLVRLYFNKNYKENAA